MNELTMNLEPHSAVPLYEQIYRYIKSDIQKGRISAGEKLPSTRSLAKYLEVSRSTLFGFQGPEDPYHGEQLPSGILESHRCQPDADELQ